MNAMAGGVWPWPVKHGIHQRSRVSEAQRLRAGTLVRTPRLNCEAVAPIRHRECQWPLGEPRDPGFRLCGVQIPRGKPYCPAHSAVAYAPAVAPISTPARKKFMADQRLVSIVDRIVNLEEEKRGLGDDIKDIYAEAKSAGYDVKGLRMVVRQRRETSDQREKRQAAENARDLMLAALGDFATSPLGSAALAAA